MSDNTLFLRGALTHIALVSKDEAVQKYALGVLDGSISIQVVAERTCARCGPTNHIHQDTIVECCKCGEVATVED